MIATRSPLSTKDQTGAAMYRMVRATANDLLRIPILYKGEYRPLGALPLVAFFDLVRRIPYRVDPRPREILARPRHSLKYASSGIDCKKKALLMGSWAAVNGFPWRFVATSKRPSRKLHHTYAEYKIGGKWLPMDATYPNYTPAMKKQITKKVVLRG